MKSRTAYVVKAIVKSDRAKYGRVSCNLSQRMHRLRVHGETDTGYSVVS